MEASQAFVALGSNVGDRRRHLEAALRRLGEATRLAAVSRAYENPPEGDAGPGDFWNAVAEVRTTLPPPALLDLLLRLEAEAGRVREGAPGPRTLDLDLLSVGGEVRTGPSLTLPHPRAVGRAFVLAPWREVAPDAVVPGTGRSVLEHEARLRASTPEAFLALRSVAILAPGGPVAPPSRPRLLSDREALLRFRAQAPSPVGFVPTMGALHEGHAALVRRARAECATVIASVFVNPLQFGAGEDLERYPRTLDADLEVLAREGTDAVYAPAPSDLYPDAAATLVEMTGPAEGLEGAIRPGHFRGVATVVAKLLGRVRPDRSYFGRKDAQQAAVVRRLVADLDLPGEVVVCPTVRDVDGLALSSRNRYLSPPERARALAIPRALGSARDLAAAGESDAAALERHVRTALEAAGLRVDYVATRSEPEFLPVSRVGDARTPALLVVAARSGATRLLDNEWVATAERRP